MSKHRKVEYKLGPENLISVEEAKRRGYIVFDWRVDKNISDEEYSSQHDKRDEEGKQQK